MLINGIRAVTEVDQAGNAIPPASDAAPVPVVGADARIDLIFKPSAGAGQVNLPATPTPYTQGMSIGGNFSLPNFARTNGKGGLIFNVVVRELLGAAAYNAQAVTADTTTDKITLAAHTLKAGNKVKFAGTLPTGLVAGTTYFVVNPGANDFQVAATYGGATIDLTVSNGAGITVSEVPLQQPLQLWLSPLALATLADGALYAPTAAEAENLLYPFALTTYLLAGQQAFAKDDQYQRMFVADPNDTAFYGALLYNNVTGGTLSAAAYLKLSLWLSRD